MDGKQLLIGGGPANMGSIRQEGRRDGTRSEAGAASITVDLVGRNKRQPGSAYCSPHRDVSQGGKPRPRENRRSSYKTRSRKKRAAAYCALREGENRKGDRHLKYLRRVCTMQRYVTRNFYSAQRYNEVRKEWVQMDGSINKARVVVFAVAVLFQASVVDCRRLSSRRNRSDSPTHDDDYNGFC